MAGELVDTAKLFARNAAVIDPRWIEPVAGDICRRSFHSPQWDAQSGFVRAVEQVTLYGLVIVPARRCDYSRIDLQHARELFIRHGIVGGAFPRPPPPLKRNLEIIAALRRRAERLRRPDAFDETGLEAFFDRAIPQDVASADALRKWLRRAGEDELRRFAMRETDWLRELRDDGFPDTVRIAGRTLRLSYRHNPGDPESDGITCTVKSSDTEVLGLWRSDWLVPGMVPEKLRWHLSALPSQYRRLLSPLEDAANILLPILKPGAAPFVAELCRAVRERWGFAVPPEAWREDLLPPHLRMRFRVVDAGSGKTIAVTRDLGEIAPRKAVAPAKNTAKSATWTFGDIPEKTEERNAAMRTLLFPALRDEGDGVSLKLFADSGAARASHAAGTTRLFALALAKTAKIPFRANRLDFAAALYPKNLNYANDAIADDILYGAAAEAFVRNQSEVRTLSEFDARLESRRPELNRILQRMHKLFENAIVRAAAVSNALEDGQIDETTADSVSTQLAWLTYRGFPRNVTLATLENYGRYLEGASVRLSRAKSNPAGDRRKEAIFAPYWERYRQAVRPENAKKANPAALQEFRWLLEEFRVSVFAQELRTAVPVSPKRLDEKWLALQQG
jgi:ATP-dependent helicase HrpA